MKYYVLADLHGRLDLLKKAHELILNTHDTDEPYHVVTLGDYIDRGPDSMGVLDYLIGESGGNTWINLKGNHEAMMVESITKPLSPDWWVGNGGDATLKSYGWGGEPYGYYAYEIVPKVHLDWINTLPYFYEAEKQVFVHAGIPQKEMVLPPKKPHHYEDMMWMLYGKSDSGGWKGKHVVHGHHQFADGPHTWFGPNGGRTDLDVYAWRSGRLVIGVFDDTQGPPIQILEVVDDQYRRISRRDAESTQD